MRSRSRFLLVLAAVIAVGGTAAATQWQRAIDLRVALERAKADAGELTRLTEENRRLHALQIPPAELARLRSDHAALPRLRAELQALEHAQPPRP